MRLLLLRGSFQEHNNGYLQVTVHYALKTSILGLSNPGETNCLSIVCTLCLPTLHELKNLPFV